MATATAITAGVGLAGGAAKFFEGKKIQKRAQKHIDDFEFSELNNVQEGRQVSTRGADLMTEQGDIQSATSTEALRAGGTRALVGGLGRVEANRNNISREAGANLDMQEKQIQGAIAQDNAAIRGMRERREAQELSGYGQMLNVGMGMKHQGVDNMFNSVASAASLGMKGMEAGVFENPFGGKENPLATSLNSNLRPRGMGSGSAGGFGLTAPQYKG